MVVGDVLHAANENRRPGVVATGKLYAAAQRLDISDRRGLCNLPGYEQAQRLYCVTDRYQSQLERLQDQTRRVTDKENPASGAADSDSLNVGA